LIYIENPALITQLLFQSKLGKSRIVPVIAAPDTIAYQFRNDTSYVQQFLHILGAPPEQGDDYL